MFSTLNKKDLETFEKLLNQIKCSSNHEKKVLSKVQQEMEIYLKPYKPLLNFLKAYPEIKLIYKNKKSPNYLIFVENNLNKESSLSKDLAKWQSNSTSDIELFLSYMVFNMNCLYLVRGNNAKNFELIYKKEEM